MPIIDIPIFGEENVNGSVQDLVDDSALSNAVISFLMSKRGDYLLNPTAGGVIDKAVFKLINSATIEQLKFEILNALTLNFSGYLELQDVLVTPDYSARMSTIEIKYKSLLSNSDISAFIYVNDVSNIPTGTYLDIVNTGENLYTFVQIKKTSMIGKKLVYDNNELCWIWGNKFKFINFTITDPRFSDILALCNL